MALHILTRETREMTQQLRAHTAFFRRTRLQLPVPTAGGLQLSVIPALEHPTPSSGLHRKLPLCAYAHPQTHMHTQM